MGINLEEARAKAKALLEALKRERQPQWMRDLANAVPDADCAAIAADGRKTNPVTSGTGAISGKTSSPDHVVYGGDIPSPNWRPRMK